MPVVATDCRGIPDQVVDGVTGFLVPQRDVSAMAAAMARLAGESDLRRRLGKAGRERAVEMFDTKKQIAKLEDVLLIPIKQ
jgi:glycosyltransferase involved in cell wall biosynthesis